MAEIKMIRRPRGSLERSGSRLMEQLLEDLTAWAQFQDEGGEADRLRPRAEAQETRTHYFFKFDLPGIHKEDIKIEVDESRLVVSGERRRDNSGEEDARRLHVGEIAYGSYLRTFDLPTAINVEKALAKYGEGVLYLTIPKASTLTTRNISIH